MFTRWLKRKLETDWLVRANVEPGTREAAATLFGYATFVIAAITGISFAGVDLGKLAIVAGALSVGIGFGLQNVVSNFVSRSEEHTSELQSLMRISYAVFCLQQKRNYLKHQA